MLLPSPPASPQCRPLRASLRRAAGTSRVPWRSGGLPTTRASATPDQPGASDAQKERVLERVNQVEEEIKRQARRSVPALHSAFFPR